MTPKESTTGPQAGGVLALLAGLVWALPGCALLSQGPELSVPEKLARYGLEPISEYEAQLPDSELGRFLPVRVLPGFSGPALPPDPAGYLVVSVGRNGETSRVAILEALEQWGRGDSIVLVVRRNPHLQLENEWWEKDVRLEWP